jgi:thioredoxin 1
MAQGRVIDVNDIDFAECVLAAPELVLVDFTAVWCPPCRAIAPHLAAVAEKYQGSLRVAACDSDENREVTVRYEVRSLPTLLLFDRGQVVGQIVGAVPRARIEALVERALTGRSAVDAGGGLEGGAAG